MMIMKISLSLSLGQRVVITIKYVCWFGSGARTGSTRAKTRKGQIDSLLAQSIVLLFSIVRYIVHDIELSLSLCALLLVGWLALELCQ